MPKLDHKGMRFVFAVETQSGYGMTTQAETLHMPPRIRLRQKTDLVLRWLCMARCLQYVWLTLLTHLYARHVGRAILVVNRVAAECRIK